MVAGELRRVVREELPGHLRSGLSEGCCCVFCVLGDGLVLGFRRRSDVSAGVEECFNLFYMDWPIYLCGSIRNSWDIWGSWE